MKIKTQGKCLKCGEICNSTKARNHLLKCAMQLPSSSQSRRDGFLVQISGVEQSSPYWMFIAIHQNASLGQLDQFLRNVWLECCGHLSKFMIGGRDYWSHTESGRPSQSMNNKVGQFLSVGTTFEHVYDMGSSTELELKVIGSLPVSPQEKITLLMRNDPPPFSCIYCKKNPEIICSMCGETICANCSKDHSCAVDEGDTYMLMTLVNSPRTGVCGYERE